jgi:hypothetical protein
MLSLGLEISATIFAKRTLNRPSAAFFQGFIQALNNLDQFLGVLLFGRLLTQIAPVTIPAEPLHVASLLPSFR